jgi:SPW repeat
VWAHLLTAQAGIWLMASPAVLDYADPARANDRIIGPIVASMATIAIWELTRPLRWVNVILGSWLLIAPWLLGHPADAHWNSLTASMLILACSLVKGNRTHHFGGGWSSLWKGVPPDGRSGRN